MLDDLPLIERDVYVLDTETTGMAEFPYDLMLEIAIYRISKYSLSIQKKLDTLIQYKPTYKNFNFKERINRCWWSKHAGITYEDTLKAPSVIEVWKQMKQILERKDVLSWNTDYDFGNFIYPMMKVFGKIRFNLLPCPMKQNVEILKIPYPYGDKFKYKQPTVSEASKYYKIVNEDTENYHRAGYDTYTTALIVQNMIYNGTYKL